MDAAPGKDWRVCGLYPGRAHGDAVCFKLMENDAGCELHIRPGVCHSEGARAEAVQKVAAGRLRFALDLSKWAKSPWSKEQEMAEVGGDSMTR